MINLVSNHGRRHAGLPEGRTHSSTSPTARSGSSVGPVQEEGCEGPPLELEIEFSSQPGFAYNFSRSDFADEARRCSSSPTRITVHKAQGSEFGICFLVLPKASRLLSRELLYTALTRQRTGSSSSTRARPLELRKFASDYCSETTRRLTNLFVAADPSSSTDRFLEERLIHRYRRARLMRSKSEVIIADQLAAAGVDYEYETPLTHRRRRAIAGLHDRRRRSRPTYYWEHCGMLAFPSTRAMGEEERWYRAQEILPLARMAAGSAGRSSSPRTTRRAESIRRRSRSWSRHLF